MKKIFSNFTSYFQHAFFNFLFFFFQTHFFKIQQFILRLLTRARTCAKCFLYTHMYIFFKSLFKSLWMASKNFCGCKGCAAEKFFNYLTFPSAKSKTTFDPSFLKRIISGFSSPVTSLTIKVSFLISGSLTTFSKFSSFCFV